MPALEEGFLAGLYSPDIAGWAFAAAAAVCLVRWFLAPRSRRGWAIAAVMLAVIAALLSLTANPLAFFPIAVAALAIYYALRALRRGDIVMAALAGIGSVLAAFLAGFSIGSLDIPKLLNRHL